MADFRIPGLPGLPLGTKPGKGWLLPIWCPDDDITYRVDYADFDFATLASQYFPSKANDFSAGQPPYASIEAAVVWMLQNWLQSTGQASIGSAPSVALSANPQTLQAGQDVDFTVLAIPSSGVNVAKVQIKNGTQLLHEFPAGTTSFKWAWKGVALGNYAIQAIATDSDGKVGKSNIIALPVTSATTPPVTGIKATAPYFAAIDDTNNIVILNSQYATNEVRWGVEGQGPQQLATNSICSPGNIAGRLYAYVVADAGATPPRLQSDTVFSAAFSLNATANNAPTVALSSPQSGKTLGVGEPVVLNATPSDLDGDNDIKRVDFFDNGVKFTETNIAPHTVQYMPNAAGSHNFTARVYDMIGATGLSNAIQVTVSSAPSPLIDATNIVVDGNSIPWGYYSGPALPTTPATINNGIDGFIKDAVTNKFIALGKSGVISDKYANVAIPGQRTEDMLDRQEGVAFKAYDPTVKRNAFLIMEGGNSMSGKGWGTVDGITQDTPQAAFNLLKQYCQLLRAKYPDAKIIVFTVLPRSLTSQPYEPDSIFWFETGRLEYNRLLRLAKANGETWLDEIADMALDGVMGVTYAAENPYYYHDGVHLSAEGAKIFARYAAEALAKVCFGVAMPAPTAVPQKVFAPSTTEENNITRVYRGDFQSFSDNTAFSNVTAMYVPGNALGRTKVYEWFDGDKVDIYGPKSVNGGAFHVFLDGKRVFIGTAYTSGATAKDVLYYSTGTIPPGIYGTQHVIAVVFIDGYGYSDRWQYFKGAGTGLIKPELTATPKDRSAAFDWTSAGNGATYTLEISEDPSFATGVSTQYVGDALFYQVSNLVNRRAYYARLTASLAGSSVFATAKVTPRAVVVAPNPMDMTGVKMRLRANGSIVTDGNTGVTKWNDEYNNANFAISNYTYYPTLNIGDLAFNGRNSVIFTGHHEMESTTVLAKLASFTVYAIVGSDYAAPQTIMSNRISGPNSTSNNYWTLKTSGFEDQQKATNWNTTILSAVKMIRYEVEPGKVRVFEEDDMKIELIGPDADRISGPLSNLVLGAQIENGDFVDLGTVSVSEILAFEGIRSAAQVENDKANLRADYGM